MTEIGEYRELDEVEEFYGMQEINTSEQVVVETMKLTLPAEPVLINGKAFVITADHEGLAKMYRRSRDHITDSTAVNMADPKKSLSVAVSFEDDYQLLTQLLDNKSPRKPVQLNREEPSLEITLPGEIEEPTRPSELIQADYKDTLNLLLLQGMIEYVNYSRKDPRFQNGVKFLARLGAISGAAFGGAAAENGDAMGLLVRGTAGAFLGGLAVLASGGTALAVSRASDTWMDWRQKRAAKLAEDDGQYATWRRITYYSEVFSVEPIEAQADDFEPAS